MSLAPDICRCHDGGCSTRETCRRWIERASGREHCRSLFPYDIPMGGHCPMRIPTDAAKS